MRFISRFLYPILILYFSLPSCGSTNKFKKLNNPKESYSNFYLLRPFSPTLSLWSFKTTISVYSDSYNPKEMPELKKEFNLSVGEYIHLYLPKGTYKLESPFFKDSKKIFFLDGKTEMYFNFYLFSDGFFSKPELFFQEIPKKKALEYLLEGNHMLAHDDF